VTLVVSDTSPIRALHFLGMLSILEEMYGPVVVPPAVERELASPRQRFVPLELAAFPFISVQSPSDQQRVDDLLSTLDLGESEALVLAIEIQADVVLIDESKGRRAATLHGVPWLGTLAVLLEAKQQGRITAVRPLVEQLTDELGFFISNALRQRVLQLAGEA
jgi:predicted nucleic acid-binding protein